MPLDDPASLLRLRNADVAARALSEGADYALHRPTEVYVQVASACNIDCIMCSEHLRPEELRHGQGLVPMPEAVFARLEQEVFPWARRLIFGVGGEPTISPCFLQYVERAAACGLELHLTTNGTRLQREVIAESVARHFQQVQVSIDAATPATYERIRGGSRWEQLLQGLELLRRSRRRLATRERCHLTLCFVLMQSNVDELPAFVELAQRCEAQAVRAQHLIPVSEQLREEELARAPGRYDRALALARARAVALGVELLAPPPFAGLPAPGAALSEPRTSHPEAPSHAIPCGLPTHSLVVLYDGRAYPCCHPYAHRKMLVGDLSRESFASIWNGPAYRGLRAGLRSGAAPPICRSCTIAQPYPPESEEPARLLAAPSLLESFRLRADPEPDGTGELERFERSGWSTWAAAVHRHASELEAERAHLRAHVANLEHLCAAHERHLAALQHEHRAFVEQARSLRGFKGFFRYLARAARGCLDPRVAGRSRLSQAELRMTNGGLGDGS